VADVDPLREELLRPPAAGWRPNPGDVLIGEVVELGEREGFAGVRYPLVTVRTEAGEHVAVHGFHTVLRDELARAQPRVGDTLGVAYHGLVEKGDSKYELYRMKVVPTDASDPSRGEPDWAAIAADAAGEREQLGEPVDFEPASDDDIPF